MTTPADGPRQLVTTNTDRQCPPNLSQSLTNTLYYHFSDPVY